MLMQRSGKRRTKTTKRPFVAFKAHLENARVAEGACEIYFYRGGYGGLSGVEGGVSNLCFIVSAEEVRRHGSDPEVVMREVVMKNARARYTLAKARPATPWLSVSFERFGPGTLTPADGLLTVGDAAAFIDPFTGSGMLMALESGQIAAEVNRPVTFPGFGRLTGRARRSLTALARDYQTEYAHAFTHDCASRDCFAARRLFRFSRKRPYFCFGTAEASLRAQLAASERFKRPRPAPGAEGASDRNRLRRGSNLAGKDKCLPDRSFWSKKAEHLNKCSRRILRRSRSNFRRPNRSPRHAVDRWEIFSIKFW